MNNLFIISISFSPDISKNNSLTNSPSLACLIVSVSVALHRLISAVNLFRSLSFDLFFFFGFSSCCKLILGDPGADSRGKAKFKQAEKYGTKESKERPEEPLKTIPDQFQTVVAVLASDWCQKNTSFLAPIRSQNGGDRLKVVW